MAIDKNHPKYQQLLKVSNPATVVRKKNSYLGSNIEIFISDSKDKKYMIITGLSVITEMKRTLALLSNQKEWRKCV